MGAEELLKEELEEELEENQDTEDQGTETGQQAAGEEEEEAAEENEEEVEGEEESEESPDWLNSEEEEGQGTVPVAAIIKAKSKLKAKINERDAEIEALKKKVETLEGGANKAVNQNTALPPDELDFDSHDQYLAALAKYQTDLVNTKVSEVLQTQTQTSAQQAQLAKIEQAANSHYERAAELIKKHGISADVYRAADANVRRVVDAIAPKQGDIIVDKIISDLGEGSEKVMFYLGNNKTALNKFQTLLQNDQSGIQAAIYLGQQKAKFNSTGKSISSAPRPAPRANGNEGGSIGAKAMLKKYNKAHKNKDIQTAYNTRKAAKAAGIDTSNW